MDALPYQNPKTGNFESFTEGSQANDEALRAAIEVLESAGYLLPDDISNLVQNDDARLSDSRTPTAHNHPSTEISDFASAVAGNAAVAANSAKRTYPSGDEAKVANIPEDTQQELLDLSNEVSANTSQLANAPADTNAALALLAAMSNVAVVNIHGSNADAARITGYAINIWVGTVDPNNSASNDLIVVTT